MGFLTKEGLQNLTNKLVQGDAIKVASHRGKNVKEIIDNIQRECENVATPNTMTLENRVNEFKVGQGRDVDVSGDVEEGKVEVELEGKTWQNLVFNITKVIGTQNCDVKVLDLNNLSFEMTYKNDITGNTSNNRAVISSDLKTMIKPDTIYTFIYKYTLLENPKSQDCQLGIAIDMWGQNLANSKICSKVGFSDINITKATTPALEKLNSISSGINFINQKGQNTKWRIDGLLVLEGDHTQTPLEELPEYFDGIKSSFEDGVVDVEVQGKNLFDKKTITVDKSLNNSGGSYENVGCNISDFIEVESNSSYVKSDTALYCEYDKDKNFIARYGNTTIVTSANCKYIRLNIISSKLENYQLEKGKIATPYEPYYKKKISFNIEEPLRSLPNGVCDEIRNSNGQWELVRRVGKVVLNGSERWLIASNNNNIMYWNVDNIGNAKTYVAPGIMPNLICDKISITTYNTAFNMNNDSTTMCLTNRNKSTTDSIAIRILNPNNHTGVLVEWLSQNPTTVYYELETPTITPVEPIEFDVKPHASININSEIAPISNHKVILNRAGQIEQSIELIANLKSRVNDLEYIYDSNLIATQYRLNNLKLNYELEREED